MMGQILPHKPVLLIMAAFSRHHVALDWARETASHHCGPVALESERFVHDETTFYQSSMGEGLHKTFFAFERLIDPAAIVELKHLSNAWEDEYKAATSWPQERPLNIDPGYLTEAKLVLATTKDRDHRLYLDRGIYTEGTLYFHRGAWQTRPWTYPDYRRADYHLFFTRCREYLRQRYRERKEP
jgi:hypothetical protein